MNKIVLLGRLTKDVELRKTASGTSVSQFTIAVSRRFAKEGEQQADFINIVAWGKTAEFVSNYFAKGQQIAVVGRLQTRNYENQEGKKVYVTEVVAEEVDFAGETKKEVKSDTFEVDNDPVGLPF